MKVLLSFALLVLASTLSIAQATPDVKCPSVSVTGPAGIANAGELTSYTATVSNAEKYSLEYLWSVNALPIKDGQGTSSIRLIHQNVMLAVTVDVKGLPEGCPASATASCACDHEPILPIKLHEFQSDEVFDKAAATRVASIMLENPNNQLYIVVGDIPGQDSSSFRQKQRSIIDLLSGQGIGRDRITMALVDSKVELFQFWRVPPGANNPRCEECDKTEKATLQCPEILVTGPAGVVGPGETMTFVATITGTIPKDVRYKWSIDSGEIVDGQGTLRLTVRDKRRWGGGVAATVTVSGLPDECPRTAAAMYAVVIHRRSENLGAINSSTYTVGRELLAKIAASLRESPDSQLYVWVYLGSDDAKFPEIKARLLAQLSRTKVDESRVMIRSTPHGPRAGFWLLPPGAEIPNP